MKPDSLDTASPDCSAPTHVHFSELQLLISRLSPLTRNRGEIGYIIYEVSALPFDNAQIVDLIVSTDGDYHTRIINTKTRTTVSEFSMRKVGFCAKGSNDTTNKTVLIAVAQDKVEGDGALPAKDVDDHGGNDGPLLTTSMTAFANWLTQKTKKELYLTQIIRCSSEFQASRLLAFASQHLEDRPSKPPPPSAPDYRQASIRLLLDIKEVDKANENFVSVPKEKPELFKFRAGIERRLFVGFSQISGLPQLAFERCLGLCIGYGRYINDSELVCLGDVELTDSSADQSGNPLPGATCFTQLSWPAKSPYMCMFDDVSGKDTGVFFTLLVHLKLANVHHPVRIQRVCRARIYPQDETFWLMADRRPLVQDYPLLLNEVLDQNKTLMIGQFADANLLAPPPEGTTKPVKTTPEINSESAEEDEAELFVSGNGVVSREVVDDQLLTEWGQLMQNWYSHARQNPEPPAASVASSNDTLESVSYSLSQRLWGGIIGPGVTKVDSPSSSLAQNIRRLVARGIPDALRAEVWHLLAACPSDETALMDAFRILVTKPCKYDAVIRRDLTRTFPANTFFRNQEGQASLFQVSRAYSLYDDEVGYCQGLSFFVAALLLHMPVEQAFTLLVQVNNHYGVRELFLEDFKGLHMRLYQLQRLVQDQLPELAKHFSDLGLETHMYASQWFLTIFTAPFPLPLVFAIVDQFLAEGMIFIFKAAISVLRMGRRELLGMDFEGVLRFLRITLPRRCLSPDTSKELLDTAISNKVTSAKLIKYAKEWMLIKSREEAAENPVHLLEQEVATLRAHVNRLERENHLLATEVVSSKTSMHQQLEELQDKSEVLTRELFAARQDIQDALEEKSHLEREALQVKQMLRCTLEERSNGRVDESKPNDAALDGSLPRQGRDTRQLGNPTAEEADSSDAARLEPKVLSAANCPHCGTPLQCLLDAKGENVIDVRIVNGSVGGPSTKSAQDRKDLSVGNTQ